MGIELPAELTAIAAKAGVSWPKADEDAMRSSATAWREAGDKIKNLGTSSDGAAGRALGGMSGGTADAARGRWAKVVAPDGDFHRAARGCHAAADRLDHAAQQVGAAKVEIVRELVTLAKNNDAATASANAGNPNALLGLDTLTKGAAANVANLQNTLSSAIRLDSGIDMSQGSQPVNTAPGAHGPGGGGGGGLLSPVTNIVGGVVAPVAGVVAPIVEPVAAVVAPVTEAVAPAVGAVTAPVAPVVGAVTAPLAPVVGAVTDAAGPILDAAGPVTAPAAAVVHPVLDAVPGGRDAAGPVFDNGAGEGPRGETPGRGEGKGLLPGIVADAGQAAGPAVAPVAHAVADVIPSVHGSLGPIAEGTTQASGAVLDPTLVRGSDAHGPVSSAPQAAAPAAQAAPAAPAMGAAPAGGPIGGAVGAVGGAVSGAVGGAPAAASQVGAVVGQQSGAQVPAQQGQAGQQSQAAQQAAKATDAKAADAKAAELKSGEAKAGEAKTGAPQGVAKTGAPGGAQALSGQVGNQPGQAQSQIATQQGPQSGNQGPGQSQSNQPSQASAITKDALAKDQAAKDALHHDSESVDFDPETGFGPQKVGDTIATPAAPGADVDLGATGAGTDTREITTSGPLATVDPGGHPASHALSDRLENRENQALVTGVAGEIIGHTYTAAAAGSWFMAIFLSAGRAPRLARKPARQLPPPPQADEQVVPRFAPDDHPQRVDTSAPRPSTQSGGLGKDHPIVQELLEGHDPLAGMHERDWESLFQHEDGTPRWPLEREGGYEDSQAEILKEGAELDRFGTPEGRVLSAAGTPFAQRSLPPLAAEEGYRKYRVTKDLPVHRTISAPWFGQPGGASRYRTTYPVADLVALGYLTEITA
ncbi:glycohydrolase toxin TNT-related protein [Lentzea sp. NPDC092896]|uniref:TNT domain-containing protein n=1 Tax=Lentzea sp. NPDC092896 TaxID=3364127 RepID=UPI0038127809